MMRTLMFASALLTVLTGASTFCAEAAQPQTQTTTNGPKVHVSESEDVTDCSNATGGALTSAGIMAGSLIGSKASGSGRGTMVGAAVGGEVGDQVGRKVRCDPRAEVEDGAQSQEPRDQKKKSSLSRFKGALGL